MSVSSLLRAQVESTRRYRFWLAVYIVSFPVGWALAVFIARLLAGRWDPAQMEYVAACLGALAIGTLMSCMLHDFLMPSLRRVRERRHDAIWLLIGAALSIVLTHFV
jgi:hypothetical protein